MNLKIHSNTLLESSYGHFAASEDVLNEIRDVTCIQNCTVVHVLSRLGLWLRKC